MRTTIRAVCSQKDESCLSNWNLTTLQLLLSILVAFTPMCLYRQEGSGKLQVVTWLLKRLVFTPDSPGGLLKILGSDSLMKGYSG